MVSQKSVISLIVLGVIYGTALLFIESKVVLLTFAGIPLLTFILLRPMFGLMLLIFYIPLSAFPSLFPAVFGIIPFLTVSKALGGITAISVFIHDVVRKKSLEFLRSSQGICFLLLLIWVVISGFFQPGEQTRECFTKYLSFLIFFYVTGSLIDSPRRFRLLLWSGILSMVIASSCGLWQYIRTVVETGEVLRAGGVWGESNYFSISLLLVIPLAYYRIYGEKQKTNKLFAIAVTLILMLAMLLTFSRGGMIGFIVLLGVSAWRAKRRIRSFIILAMVLLVIAVSMPKYFWERVEKVGVALEEKKAYTSTYRRVLLTKAGWRMIMDHPLTGVGVGNFYWSLPKYVSVVPGLAHNMYIEVAAELGLPGFFLFMTLIYFTLRDLRGIMRKREEPDNFIFQNYALGLQAGLIGFLTSAIFLHAEYEKFFWLVIFLTVSLKKIQEERQLILRLAQDKLADSS